MTPGSLSWKFRGRVMDFTRPRLMGILNVTPDSFSDGGAYASPAEALHRAEILVEEGADILDVGGESTRPGATPVPLDEELRRVLPVLREMATWEVPVSIDTRRAAVARAALEAGAAIVNDVSALGEPEMGPVVAAAGAGLVLMHMQGTPGTMQENPHYDDVVREVRAFLVERRESAGRAGIGPEAVVLDPGLGFGKTVDHNLALLARLGELVELGSPILVGASRKRFLGVVGNVAVPRDRLPASLAAVLVARARGAVLFRVHDVAATREALAVFEAVAGG